MTLFVAWQSQVMSTSVIGRNKLHKFSYTIAINEDFQSKKGYYSNGAMAIERKGKYIVHKIVSMVS